MRTPSVYKVLLHHRYAYRIGEYPMQDLGKSSRKLLYTPRTLRETSGSPFFIRDTVARDLASYVVPSDIVQPNVRPSVLPHVTEAIGVRPTARPAESRGSVVPRSRSRSGSLDGAMRSPRLRRPPDGAIPAPQRMCVHNHLHLHRLRHPHR